MKYQLHSVEAIIKEGQNMTKKLIDTQFFKIGDLKTVVTLHVYLMVTGRPPRSVNQDRISIDVSHQIFIPEIQASSHEPRLSNYSQYTRNSVNEIVENIRSQFMDFYDAAVGKGLTPTESWLVAT